MYRSADGNSQSENIFLEVSPQLVEPSAAFPTEADAPFSLVFNMAAGDEGLKDSIGPLYVHTGVSIDGQDWQYATTWGDNNEKYKLTSLGNNRWQLDMPQGIRAFYDQVPQDKTIERLCFVVRNEDCTARNRCNDSPAGVWAHCGHILQGRHGVPGGNSSLARKKARCVRTRICCSG